MLFTLLMNWNSQDLFRKNINTFSSLITINKFIFIYKLFSQHCIKLFFHLHRLTFNLMIIQLIYQKKMY